MLLTKDHIKAAGHITEHMLVCITGWRCACAQLGLQQAAQQLRCTPEPKAPAVLTPKPGPRDMSPLATVWPSVTGLMGLTKMICSLWYPQPLPAYPVLSTGPSMTCPVHPRALQACQQLQPLCGAWLLSPPPLPMVPGAGLKHCLHHVRQRVRSVEGITQPFTWH